MVVMDCNALVFAVNKINLNPRIARWTLALQNYRFKVIHCSAERMAHVDALSRQIAYIDSMSIERELELKQLCDARIKSIVDELKFKDSDKFELTNGLIYRKGPDRPRFVVPEAIIENIMRREFIMTKWRIAGSKRPSKIFMPPTGSLRCAKES